MSDTSKSINATIQVAKTIDDFYTKLASATDGTIIMMEGEGLTGYSKSGAPTTSTIANAVNDIYKDSTNNKIYICDAITTTSSGTTYTWVQLIRATDYATADVGGAIRVNPSLGLAIYPSGSQQGQVYVVRATDAEVTAKSNSIRPLVPSTIDLAIKAGLGNYAGTAFTDAEKTTARNTIGAGTPYTVTVDV